jgi:LysM repeat protein
MPNIKPPRVVTPFPSPEHLANGTPYKVKDGDNWWSIAAANRIDAGALISFNFKTSDPAEINWYLREKVGCRKETPDHDNYWFSSTDVPGTIYIPRMPPPPCAYDVSKSFEIEAREASRTRQRSIDVANRFFTTVGAVGRTGRFIPTITDTKYWFAKLYEIMTALEIDAARNYKHPGFVLHFIPIFYGMYNRALDGWAAGGAGVSPLWREHFKLTGRPAGSGVLGWSSQVIASIVSGTTAHVRGDMGEALANAYRSYVNKYCLNPAPPFDTFRQDFFAMGGVFNQAQTAVMSLVASLGPVPEGAVKIGESMGPSLDINEVEKWRAEAWADAKRRLGQ